MNTDNIFTGICFAVVIIMLVYYFNHKKRLRAFLFGSLTGISALILINKFGGVMGAGLPLNTFNTVGSVVLGVPFVVCMIVLKFI